MNLLSAMFTFVAGVVLAGPAPAADARINSVYTSFDSKTCPHKEGTDIEDYGAWTCPGYGGQPVILEAGDQRMYVTFGNATDDNIASRETLSHFNDVYEGTVEWRVESSAEGKPHTFATILRWNVMLGTEEPDESGAATPRGRVLVVTRLAPGGVCHVGYVDALANPEANALARKLADDHARIFRCGKDKPIVVGAVSPGLGLGE